GRGPAGAAAKYDQPPPAGQDFGRVGGARPRRRGDARADGHPALAGQIVAPGVLRWLRARHARLRLPDVAAEDEQRARNCIEPSRHGGPRGRRRDRCAAVADRSGRRRRRRVAATGAEDNARQPESNVTRPAQPCPSFAARSGPAPRAARPHPSNPGACAGRSSCPFAPCSGAARRLASLHSARKPRNPAPALAAHPVPSRLAPARLGGSRRCTPLASLETPRLRSPLMVFLRGSLPRRSAGRLACPPPPAAEPPPRRSPPSLSFPGFSPPRPRARAPHILFLRGLLRRGWAARDAALRSQASNPRACARRS